MASEFERICTDRYTFRAGLADGSVFQFESAEEDGDWLMLDEARPISGPACDEDRAEYPFEWDRPVRVRKAAIVWLGDYGH